LALEQVSAVSLPVDLRANGNSLGPATAFFMNHNGKRFLVSNWHVFSGRNTYTGQPLHSSGATPDSFLMKLHTEPLGSYLNDTEVPLLDKNGDPIWKQHPNGQDYDIACVEVGALPENVIAYAATDLPQSDIRLSVAQDVQIVGFPRGFAAQGILPVWKRGTIAAEPLIARDDGLPILLVDTATREGMSGSPTYLYSIGGYVSEQGDHVVAGGTSSRFLGIYSGRYGSINEENNMQLGRVWRLEALKEMLDSPQPASYELRSQ